MHICGKCNGRGHIDNKVCNLCNGAGVPLKTRAEESFLDALSLDGTLLNPGDPGYIEFEEDDYDY